MSATPTAYVPNRSAVLIPFTAASGPRTSKPPLEASVVDGARPSRKGWTVRTEKVASPDSSPPGFRTTMMNCPALPLSMENASCVSLNTVAPVGLPLMRTSAPLSNPVPNTVTVLDAPVAAVVEVGPVRPVVGSFSERSLLAALMRAVCLAPQERVRELRPRACSQSAGRGSGRRESAAAQ